MCIHFFGGPSILNCIWNALALSSVLSGLPTDMLTDFLFLFLFVLTVQQVTIGSFQIFASPPFMNVCSYLLTPWYRVLLEKLTGLQLVKKFPAFHRTLRFITALTSVRHLFLSSTSPIQSTYPHPTSWRSILILSTHYV